MKRTVTVKFEITRYQRNQIKTLGRLLWLDTSLPCDELCRRVLLDSADRMLTSGDRERLLERGCLPTRRPMVA